jgi:mycothiol synthase
MASTQIQGFVVRPPTHDDIPAIIELMTAFDLAHLGFADAVTPNEVADDWRNVRLESDAWLFFAPDGTLAAYGMTGDHGSGQLWSDGYVRPGFEGRGIGTAILRFAEARARERMANAPEGIRVALNSGVLLDDERAAQLFTAHGFEMTRVHWRMAIELTEEPPAPRWPEGIVLREFVPGQDERAVFDCIEEAFTDHWGHVPRRFEDWVERTSRPDFDPSLWFLAVDVDDPATIAGVSTCRQNPDQGWLGTLAVRRPWRQRGLGRALVLHTFGAFWRRGERKVGLGADSQNLTGAVRLYESVGMHPTMRIASYEKELRAGVDLSTRELVS